MQNQFIDVGTRIAELRGQRTKQEFAARLQVDRKTIERWEAGERLPDGSKLLRLMVEFKADMNYLLSGQRGAGVLSAEERTMLDYFRGASPTARRAAMGALLGAVAPSMSQITQSGSGVQQVNTGDGAVMIGSGSAVVRKARKGSAA